MNSPIFFSHVWPLLSQLLAKEINMSGPKSPYGYDPIFHEALAAITLESPRVLALETDKNPNHMRALFNQFRNSWMIQSNIHHKRKEHGQETACRQNYYRLMQYECKRTEGGIVLVARASAQATLKTEGRVELYMPVEPERPQALAKTQGPKKPGVFKFNDTSPEEMAKIPHYDSETIANAAAAALGIVRTEKLERVIEDNPPTNPDTNKYGLPIGPPPGFPDE